MIEAGKNEVEARAFAKKLSEANPNHYVVLCACFGIFAEINKRLNVFAPSDSLFGVYWLNGKERSFSEAKKIADQNATPSLH
tara:strand:+ start:67 stop:312 length:246 start_codon:yes stop_codon:yes gene_type:complete